MTLGEFAGVPVTGGGVMVTRLASGFAKTMAVEPVTVEAGDVVHLLVRAVKVADRYEYEIEDGEIVGARLTQVFQATAGRFTNDAGARAAIDEIEALIRRHDAESAGQLALDLDDLGDVLPPIAAARRAEYGDLPRQVDEALRGDETDD